MLAFFLLLCVTEFEFCCLLFCVISSPTRSGQTTRRPRVRADEIVDILRSKAAYSSGKSVLALDIRNEDCFPLGDKTICRVLTAVLNLSTFVVSFIETKLCRPLLADNVRCLWLNLREFIRNATPWFCQVLGNILKFFWWLFSGGCDRQGRSVITIPAGRSEELNTEQLSETLNYLTQVSRY